MNRRRAASSRQPYDHRPKRQRLDDNDNTAQQSALDKTTHLRDMGIEWGASEGSAPGPLLWGGPESQALQLMDEQYRE